MKAVDGEDAEHEVVQRQDGRFGSVHGVALILLAATMLLAPFATRRYGMRGFVATYAIALLCSAARPRPANKTLVIVIALALRLPFLFHDPQLSGDVYRYLSDGRVSASGGNPYTYTPSDPRINHPEIRSIYPPHAQLVFRFVHELTPWRLLLIAADVAVIALLPPVAAYAYATSPLVLIESTWSAHIDALAAAVLLIALLRKSGFAAGIAAGLKLIPLAAIAPLLKNAPRTHHPKLTTGFLAALALPAIPFLGAPIMPGLRDYATRWIFNSPLYDVTRALVERVDTKAIWTHHPLRVAFLSDFVYRHLYADFLTRAILATLAVAAILCARNVTNAIAALLLCSPAIHPWYWLTLVPCALVERSRWIWFAVFAPFSSLLYEGAPPIAIYAICYGVPAFACVASRSFFSPSRSSTPALD